MTPFRARRPPGPRSLGRTRRRPEYDVPLRLAAIVVRFVDESPDQARARRVREGPPPAVIESALAISAYQRAGGKTVTITNTIAELTGRPPRTVGEFVREHAGAFRG